MSLFVSLRLIRPVRTQNKADHGGRKGGDFDRQLLIDSLAWTRSDESNVSFLPFFLSLSSEASMSP